MLHFVNYANRLFEVVDYKTMFNSKQDCGCGLQAVNSNR